MFEIVYTPIRYLHHFLDFVYSVHRPASSVRHAYRCRNVYFFVYTVHRKRGKLKLKRHIQHARYEYNQIGECTLSSHVMSHPPQKKFKPIFGRTSASASEYERVRASERVASVGRGKYIDIASVLFMLSGCECEKQHHVTECLTDDHQSNEKTKHKLYIYIEAEQKHIHSLRFEQSMQRNLNNNTAVAAAATSGAAAAAVRLFSVGSISVVLCRFFFRCFDDFWHNFHIVQRSTNICVWHLIKLGSLLLKRSNLSQKHQFNTILILPCSNVFFKKSDLFVQNVKLPMQLKRTIFVKNPTELKTLKLNRRFM